MDGVKVKYICIPESDNTEKPLDFLICFSFREVVFRYSASLKKYQLYAAVVMTIDGSD